MSKLEEQISQFKNTVSRVYEKGINKQSISGGRIEDRKTTVSNHKEPNINVEGLETEAKYTVRGTHEQTQV